MKNNITSAIVAEKNIVISEDGKEWMISGFSDYKDQDWYNIYDYNIVLTGEDWIPYFDEKYEGISLIDQFEGTDFSTNKRPVLSSENLLIELNKNKFKQQKF